MVVVLVPDMHALCWNPCELVISYICITLWLNRFDDSWSLLWWNYFRRWTFLENQNWDILVCLLRLKKWSNLITLCLCNEKSGNTALELVSNNFWTATACAVCVNLWSRYVSLITLTNISRINWFYGQLRRCVNLYTQVSPIVCFYL